MPSQRGIKAGRAYVELFADDSRLVRGLKRAQWRLKMFGASLRAIGFQMMAAGTAMLAPFGLALRTFMNAGDRLGKLSKRTGISVEALSELAFAAERSGTNLNSVERATRRMQRSIWYLFRGLSTTKDAFRVLGLRYQDLVRLSPDKQFTLIADRLGRLKDESMKAAISQEVFGRSGTELLPMLQEGAASVGALRAECRRLGLTMSTEEAAAAEQFADTMHDLWAVLKRVAFIVGAAVAPYVKKFAQSITETISKVIRWVKENRELIVALMKIAVGIVAAGAALVGLGMVFGSLAAILGGIIGALTTIGAILGFLLSPIGIVAAAFATLGGVFLKSSKQGARILGWLGEQFQALKDDALRAFDGIRDALAGGDIKLAAKILWLTLKMEWQKGMKWLNLGWQNFVFGLKAAWEQLQHRIVGIWLDLWYQLRIGSEEFLDYFQRSHERITGWLSKIMIDVRGFFDKSVDVDEAKKAIDQMTEARLRGIDTEHDSKIKALNDEYQTARKLAEEDHQNRLAQISDEHDQRIAKSKDAIAKARAELDTALEAARRKREEAAKAAGAKAGKGSEQDFGSRIAAGIARAGAMTATFSAAALGGLGISPELSETNEHLRRIEKNTEGLKFA